MVKSRDFKKLRATTAPEGDHNSNWAISYGDMVTLLLAFFVLFFSVSKTSNEIKIVEKALKKDFDQEVHPKPTVTWGQQNRTPTAEMTDFFKDQSLKTTIQGNKLIVEFPQISFFNVGSFSLTNEGLVMLKKFGNTLSKFTGQMRIVVRGYTDNTPVKVVNWKPFKDNLELSALRAISALRALSHEGIPYHLLRIGGYGETDKSTQSSDETIKKYDRKIVLVIEPLDNTERGLEGLYSKSKENLEQIQKTESHKNETLERQPTNSSSEQGVQK